MKALILAAGKGTRLAPYTDRKPKGMVKIGGKPILQYAIENFRKNGIEEIYIITGYKSELISFPGVQYFHNDQYASTNMVHTLFCAEEIMTGDLIISYGDIIFENKILQQLLQDPDDISVVLDDNWLKLWELRSENPLEDAETLKLDNETYITEIGDTPENYQQIDSQYIGLIKLSAKGCVHFKNTHRYLQKFESEKEVIRNRNVNQIYMTDFLQILINIGVRIKGVRIKGGWIEVDTNKDYELFLKMYKESILNRFVKLSL